MFRSICQLSPNDWSGWELHSELDEILALSRKLHSDQKNWLREAHWRPKGGWNPSDSECQICANLPSSEFQMCSVHLDAKY